jgi:hypothetical protein
MKHFILIALLSLTLAAGEREIVYLDNQGVQWKEPGRGRQAVYKDSLEPGRTPESVPAEKIPVKDCKT